MLNSEIHNVCAYQSSRMEAYERIKNWNICWAQIADAFKFSVVAVLGQHTKDENMTLLHFYYDASPCCWLKILFREFMPQRIYSFPPMFKHL